MWLFRLPVWVYLIVAPLGIALAGYLYLDDRQAEADKAIARAGKAPAPVKIETFDASRNTGAAHEVNVVAQVDVSQMMELTQSKKGSVRERWVLAPIYSTVAADTKAPALGLLIQRGGASDDQLRSLVVADGPIGPVMKLDGFLLDKSAENTAIDQMRDRVQLAPGAIFIDPFEAGRDAGLAASTGGRDSALIVLVGSLLVAAYGLFHFFARPARKRKTAAISKVVAATS